MMTTKLHLVVQFPGACLTGHSSQSGSWSFILTTDLHCIVSCRVGHYPLELCMSTQFVWVHLLAYTIYLVVSVVCPTQIGCDIGEVQVNLSTRILVQ